MFGNWLKKVLCLYAKIFIKKKQVLQVYNFEHNKQSINNTANFIKNINSRITMAKKFRLAAAASVLRWRTHNNNNNEVTARQGNFSMDPTISLPVDHLLCCKQIVVIHLLISAQEKVRASRRTPRGISVCVVDRFVIPK